MTSTECDCRGSFFLHLLLKSCMYCKLRKNASKYVTMQTELAKLYQRKGDSNAGLMTNNWRYTMVHLRNLQRII